MGAASTAGADITVMAARAEIERARGRWHEAREIYARIGAAPYLAQTDTLLERLDE